MFWMNGWMNAQMHVCNASCVVCKVCIVYGILCNAMVWYDMGWDGMYAMYCVMVLYGLLWFGMVGTYCTRFLYGMQRVQCMKCTYGWMDGSNEDMTRQDIS